MDVWLRADPHDGNDPLDATVDLAVLPRVGDQVQVWDPEAPMGGGPVYLLVEAVVHTAWAPDAAEVWVRLDQGYDAAELRRVMANPRATP